MRFQHSATMRILFRQTACLTQWTTVMLGAPMKPPGTYKLLGRQRADDLRLEPMRLAGRAQRIIDSLRHQITSSEEKQSLRIRQIFTDPVAIYRLEIEVPELNYQRITLLDGDALEELLDVDEVRTRLAEAIA